MDTVLRGRAVELFAEAVPGLDGGESRKEQNGDTWKNKTVSLSCLSL